MKTLDRRPLPQLLPPPRRSRGAGRVPPATRPPVADPSRLRTLARALTIMGLACLSVAVFQTWIGNVSERREQRTLRGAFQQILSTGAGLGRDADGNQRAIEAGSAVALLEIPKIGVRKIVVEGSGANELKRGPGLLPSSPLPGQPGHTIIVGRRTTYGSPFKKLDTLTPQDDVKVTTPYGQFAYKIRGVETVSPGKATKLEPTEGSLLSLLTSDAPHIGGSALMVTAVLDGDPSTFADPPRKSAGEPGSVTFAGNAGAGPGAAALGVLLLSALVGADSLYRRWRRWPTYLLTTPVIIALLLAFMENLSSLLPTTL